MINPALVENSCQVDYDLLASRVSAIAKVAFTLLIAAIPMALISSFGSLVLVSMAAVTLSVTYVDAWAAERAADAKAVSKYLQKKRPSKSATQRIRTNLSAAQRLVQEKGDLNKDNREGYRFSYYIGRTDFEVFKCFVDGGMKLNSDAFASIIKLPNSRFLEYVLAQKKITVADFTPDQQVHFWRILGNQRAGAVLAAHGFNINIRDSQGFTPLLAAVACNNLSVLDRVVLVKTLLQCGADKSPTVAIGSQPARTALELTKDPKIREAIENTVQIPLSKPSCWDAFRKIPLIYPALEQNSCVVDQSLLKSRVAAIAKVAFAMLVLAIPMAALSPIGSLALVVLSALSYALPLLDSWRAESAADVKAVNEYLQMERPSTAATKRIQNNPKLLSELVKRKGDVNKLDETGDSCIPSLNELDFATFKYLIDTGKSCRTLFREIVRLKNSTFLDYVLTQNKVKASDFTEVEQHNVWKGLGCKESGDLLRRYQFNINSRNSAGCTPLMVAADSGTEESNERVKMLLACGANKSLTVSFKDPNSWMPNKKIVVTALSYAKDPKIRTLLA